MMKINDMYVDSYMTLTVDFDGIRVLGDTLQPTKWHLEVDVVAVDSGDGTHEDLVRNGQQMFMKLSFWLENILNCIVVTDGSNEFGIDVATGSDNPMMYLHCEPTDDIMLQAIHHKLRLISEDKLYIGTTRLSSTDTSVSYTFNTEIDNEEMYDLPKNSDYLPFKIAHSFPWWRRQDGYTFEFIIPEGLEEDEIKDAMDKLVDPLDLYDTMAEQETYDQEDQEPAEIIEVDLWKPKTV